MGLVWCRDTSNNEQALSRFPSVQAKSFERPYNAGCVDEVATVSGGRAADIFGRWL